MIIAVKRAVKGVHEKVINYLKHKSSSSKPCYRPDGDEKMCIEN